MFPQQLRKLRKQKKLSQTALGEIFGLSQQAIGKWETGRSAPDPRMLEQLADLFGVSVDYLLGREDTPNHPGAGPVLVPVIGIVKAGYNAFAFEEDYGWEPADVKSPEDYFYLIVNGDSMEPRIHAGDLALVHRQFDVESGDLAVVLVHNEEGTLKKVIKKEGAVILQPFNPTYQTQIYMGEDLGQISIVGKVVETKTKW